MIDKNKTVIGGQSNQNEKFISPTVMTGVTKDDRVMQDEIFGPILPIIPVSGHKEAIEFINERYFFNFWICNLKINMYIFKDVCILIFSEKPLALYVFTNNSKVFEEFQNNTSSGSVGLNEVLMQISCNYELFFISINNQ